MTFLFGRGTPREKLQFIIKATRMHSFNLMKFASLYKFLQIVLRRTNGGKARSMDSFIAGIVGGWVVFGERTAVNEQVSIARAHTLFTVDRFSHSCPSVLADCPLLLRPLRLLSATPRRSQARLPSSKAHPYGQQVI